MNWPWESILGFSLEKCSECRTETLLIKHNMCNKLLGTNMQFPSQPKSTDSCADMTNQHCTASVTNHKSTVNVSANGLTEKKLQDQRVWCALPRAKDLSLSCQACEKASFHSTTERQSDFVFLNLTWKLKVHCVIFRMIYRQKCNIIYITTFSEEYKDLT